MVKKSSKACTCQLQWGREGKQNFISSSCGLWRSKDVEGPTWLQVGKFAKSTT